MRLDSVDYHSCEKLLLSLSGLEQGRRTRIADEFPDLHGSCSKL
jgi:hypothetical protein